MEEALQALLGVVVAQLLEGGRPLLPLVSGVEEAGGVHHRDGGHGEEAGGEGPVRGEEEPWGGKGSRAPSVRGLWACAEGARPPWPAGALQAARQDLPLPFLGAAAAALSKEGLQQGDRGPGQGPASRGGGFSTWQCARVCLQAPACTGSEGQERRGESADRPLVRTAPPAPCSPTRRGLRGPPRAEQARARHSPGSRNVRSAHPRRRRAERGRTPVGAGERPGPGRPAGEAPDCPPSGQGATEACRPPPFQGLMSGLAPRRPQCRAYFPTPPQPAH